MKFSIEGQQDHARTYFKLDTQGQVKSNRAVRTNSLVYQAILHNKNVLSRGQQWWETLRYFTQWSTQRRDWWHSIVSQLPQSKDHTWFTFNSDI